MGNIPTVTKNLLIVNVLAYLATVVLKTSLGIDLNDLLGLHFFTADWLTSSLICLPCGCSAWWWSAFGDQGNFCSIIFRAEWGPD